MKYCIQLNQQSFPHESIAIQIFIDLMTNVELEGISIIPKTEFMRKPTVSICVIAMNRLHHVQETLPVSLRENDDQGVNFVLLDYNSSDGLGEYVQKKFPEELRKGKLTYYRHNEAQVFDRSHSRNMALKLADGKIVCNVDADNYTGLIWKVCAGLFFKIALV
jgi:hypothetical protein